MNRDDILKAAFLFALAAAALTAWVAWQGAPLPGDRWLTVRIQDLDQLRHNQTVINAANAWAWFFVAAAVALVLWGHRLGGGVPSTTQRREALAAFAAAVLLRYGSSLIKLIARSPRPVADLDVHVDRFRDSYGFPSGHVYGDVLMYGVLAVMAAAFLSPKLAVALRAVAIVIIILAGPARVVIGAHWPSDTAGGYLWGAAALSLSVWFGRWVSQRE